jgi:hypothetical protein
MPALVSINHSSHQSGHAAIPPAPKNRLIKACFMTTLADFLLDHKKDIT